MLSRVGKSALSKVEEIGDKALLDDLIENWLEIKDMPTSKLQSIVNSKHLSDTKDHERLQLMIVMLYRKDKQGIREFIDKKSTGNYLQDIDTVKYNILKFCNSDIIRNSDSRKLEDLKMFTNNIISNDFNI